MASQYSNESTLWKIRAASSSQAVFTNGATTTRKPIAETKQTGKNYKQYRVPSHGSLCQCCDMEHKSKTSSAASQGHTSRDNSDTGTVLSEQRRHYKGPQVDPKNNPRRDRPCSRDAGKSTLDRASDTQSQKQPYTRSECKCRVGKTPDEGEVVMGGKQFVPSKKNIPTFQRVDEIYDPQVRDWSLVETRSSCSSRPKSTFVVRRCFNADGTLKETYLDIQATPLHSALQELFKNGRELSLEGNTPYVSSRALFHRHEDIRTYVELTLVSRLEKAQKPKLGTYLTKQIAQCRLLLSYVDEDFAIVRTKLTSMLVAGVITHDLVWALFKPNTIVVTSAYQNNDELRCFRVTRRCEYECRDGVTESCVVNGEYLENDGRLLGMADIAVTIPLFHGQSMITSLKAYPLKYHENAEVCISLEMSCSHI
jgi:hypothetical protein